MPLTDNRREVSFLTGRDFFEADFPLTIDEQAVFRLQGYKRPQDRPDQRVRQVYEEMLEHSRRFFHSRGIMAFHPVSAITENTVIVRDEVTLTGKNIARTFRGADYLAVALVTIGAELEQEVRDLFSRNELVGGLMLDSIGSEAAEAAALHFDRTISAMIAPLGWKRTPRMSPGYGSFDIREQEYVFSLIDPRKTGVTLSSSFIMVPQKSVSFLVGCGNQVKNYGSLSPCRVCDVRDCPVRDLSADRCQS